METPPSGIPSVQPAAGWPTSFVELYRASYDPMVRLAYLLVGSQSLAEEVVQEAFVRIRGHLDGVEHPGAYLRSTVVNLARNQLRRRALERDVAARARPEASVDEVDELSDALAALPYRQRAVLVLRYYQDCSEAEIASILGCRPGTVKSLASRGLSALRGVLAS